MKTKAALLLTISIVLSGTAPAPIEEIPAEVPPPVPLPVQEEPVIELYDVPLDEELQLHIIQLCEENAVDPAIVFAMIYKESGYNPNAVGDDGDSLGLMQIQPKWHSDRMQELGCPDLFDPFQNVTVGISILAEKLEKYSTVGEALTAYNAGDSGAYEHYFSKGIYANGYAEAVMAHAEELNK